jgi:hypothetical protein
MPNWSVKYLSPHNIISLSIGQMACRSFGIKIPRHRRLRSNLTSHLSSSRPKNVGKIVKARKMSLIKWGSARCHSRVWNRDIDIRGKWYLLTASFPLERESPCWKRRDFRWLVFFFQSPSRTRPIGRQNTFLDFLFLLTEQTTSNERRQYTVNKRWHSDGGELKTN